MAGIVFKLKNYQLFFFAFALLPYGAIKIKAAKSPTFVFKGHFFADYIIIAKICVHVATFTEAAVCYLRGFVFYGYYVLIHFISI